MNERASVRTRTRTFWEKSQELLHVPTRSVEILLGYFSAQSMYSVLNTIHLHCRATSFSYRLTRKKCASLAWFDFSIFNLNSFIWRPFIRVATNQIHFRWICIVHSMNFRIEIEIIIKFQKHSQKQIRKLAQAHTENASCSASTMWNFRCHVSCACCVRNKFFWFLLIRTEIFQRNSRTTKSNVLKIKVKLSFEWQTTVLKR